MEFLTLSRRTAFRLHVNHSFILVLSLAVGFITTNLQADQPIRASEYELKAAFLYNFANFITWPSEVFARPDSAFVIGIVGTDPFGPTLEQVLNGQRWNGRPIAIVRFSHPQEIRAVQLLFVSESERKHWPEVQAAAGSASILTVSDMRDFCALGGMIQFVAEHNRLGFHMNVAAANRARLAVSSKLLKLATVVTKGEP